MSKIILINGACGIGKTTISEKLHKNFLLSFLFQRDKLRRKISNYKFDEKTYKKSGEIINSLLFGIIKTSIEKEITLIIDAVFVDEKIIKKIEEIVLKSKGKFLHFYLFAEKEIWKKRLENRGISGSLDFKKAEYFYDNLKKVSKKFDMIKIDTTNKNESKVLDEVLEKI